MKKMIYHPLLRGVAVVFFTLLGIGAAMADDETVFSGFLTTGGTNPFGFSESGEHLVDGIWSDGNKWCCSIDDADLKYEGTNYIYVEFEAETAIDVTGYILTTGNDNSEYEGRNPYSWVILAKLDEEDDWTEIARVDKDDTLKDEDYTDYSFSVDQPGAYRYFRFMVSETQGESYMQLGELRFFGTVDPTDIKYAKVEGIAKEYAYTGTAIKPVPTSVTLRGEELTAGTDYTLSWSGGDFIQGGVYRLILTGTGDYTGTKSITYIIRPWTDNGGYCGAPQVNGGRNLYYEITESGGEKTITIRKTPGVKGSMRMADYDHDTSSEDLLTFAPWLSAYYDEETDYYEECDEYEDEEGNSWEDCYDVEYTYYDYHFDLCDLTHVVIEEGVESIGEGAFFHCEGLQSVSIAGSVTEIGFCAFDGCNSLASVNIPVTSRLTKMGASAFLDCLSLSSITIPAEVQDIHHDTFLGCGGMTDVSCFADPTVLNWDEDGDDFCEDKATICHVFDESAWEDFEEHVNVTFRGDLTVDLADAADNSAVIAAISNQTGSVRLADRTLYRDDSWNTLCLPFDTDLTDTTSPLYGATARALDRATYNEGVLTILFNEVNTLEAGKPYLIKWASGEDITNPVFAEVNVTASAPTSVNGGALSFVGTFAPYSTDADPTMLYLGGDNTLYYPASAITVNAQRAYFTLNNGLTFGSGANQVNRFVLRFDGDDVPTTITEVRSQPADPGYYTIDGRRLQGKPTQKGVYVHNGKKVVF